LAHPRCMDRALFPGIFFPLASFPEQSLKN
jgi:hypothetical protein